VSTVRCKTVISFLVLVGSCFAQAPTERYYPANVNPEFELIDGKKAFFLTAPKPGPNHPWVWFAPVRWPLAGQPPNSDILWMFRSLIDKGISVGGIDVGESYGSPKGSAAYTLFYEKVIQSRKWSAKPCLLAQSRGGLMEYNWAIRHPFSVACIAGIYPVVNLNSWPSPDHRAEVETEYDNMSFEKLIAEYNPVDHLKALAAEHVPLLNIHGFDDQTVSYSLNSELLTNEYKRLGGQADLITLRGRRHGHVRGDPLFFESVEMLNFLVKYAQ
jgi:hypothetical protein